jgi:RNA polymerase sigma factor (sigma-70 family)
MTVNEMMPQIPPEEKDFFQKVTALKEKLFNYFNSITKNRSVANDLVQEVFLTVYEQYILGFYCEQGKLDHYLMKIAANTSKDYLRTKKRHRDRMADYKTDICNNFGWSEPTCDYLTQTTEETDILVKENIVDNLLNNKFDFLFLNSDERRILRMRHGNNYSFIKISETFNLPATAIALRYRTAIKKIRRAIKKGVVR